MRTWAFIRAVAILVFTLGAQIARSEPLQARRPNIVFLLMDDQGYGDFSCNGNPILRTPNMDRLGTNGVRFSDFHVSPTCSPTRSALMSGRHEFMNGVTHTILERERMSLKTITLAQVLKGAGYTTGIFGKWHLGDEDAYQPDRRGFDEVFIHGGGGIGQTFPGSCGDAPGNTYFNPAIKHNGRFEKTQGYCTDLFFGAAEKWINSLRGNKKPFFAYVACNAPHTPLQVRPEDEARYAGKVPKDVAKFFGMIANIDDNVGRLMAKLKEWGLEENTLVIIMNDNGGFPPACEIFNAGMSGHKNTAWEGGTRAASFWYWPAGVHPGISDALTAHIDVLPTLAELAGAKLDSKLQQQVEGRSLVPLLENPQADWSDRYLFTHIGRWGGDTPGLPPQEFGSGPAQCSMRSSQYSLVRGEGQWQLFDVKADIGQKHDIASRQPAVLEKMSSAYDAWWQRVLPHLENEEAYKTAPKINPFKEEYWKQMGGKP